jgi:hypothetical protein
VGEKSFFCCSEQKRGAISLVFCKALIILSEARAVSAASLAQVRKQLSAAEFEF